MAIFIAIIGLGLLIVLHEWGHFIAARLCGMRVERFSVGFGPPILSVKRGETIYQIAPVPLGGFVQITGLNPHEEFDHDDPRVYPNRPRWQRFATVVAGPVANYITAILIMLFVYVGFGVPVPTNEQRVIEPLAGRPAAAAGLKAGDILVKADGRALTPTLSLTEVIKASEGKPVSIDVRRDGKPLSISVTPAKVKSGDFQIGAQIGPVVVRKAVPFVSAVKEAVYYPVWFSGEILSGLSKMIRGQVKADLTGPVGITKQIARAADQGLLEYLGILAMLSVYLGLFNLLPLPALDGGRAVFLGAEWLSRGRISPRVEAAVHMVGFVLLMGVLLLVTFKDIFM